MARGNDGIVAGDRTGRKVFLKRAVEATGCRALPPVSPAASELFANLPAAVKRSRRLKLPVDWRDPTEAVRSSEILDAVSRRFEVLERHDYGGNFLAVIHPHLRLLARAG